jgi:hypothetical protein
VAKEIEDSEFGRLSLVDGDAYFSEIPWERELDIRLFIHVDGADHIKFIERAKTIFASVRKNEMELFNQAVEYLTSSENLSTDYFEMDSAAEVSIEIFPDGKGQLVYLVFMVGSLSIEFTPDASFINASILLG